MAFILDDILRIPGKLLRRVVTVKKGSRQMMLLGSETTDGPASRGPCARRSSRGHQTGEDLVWPKTLAILDNTVLAPLKFVRWIVNSVRRQVDLAIANESESADRSASGARARTAARRRRRSAPSDRR